MNHLQDISMIIFLEVGYGEITKRIHNFDTRGIARAKDQTFRDLFNERQILYNRYAELTIDCNDLDQEDLAEDISKKVRNFSISDGRLFYKVGWVAERNPTYTYCRYHQLLSSYPTSSTG